MSNRYKGAVISATPPTTTGGESGTASGAWTLEQQMQLQAAGLWPAQPTGPFIEDVFSTYLYAGNNSTQDLTNGIDMSGKGGLSILKIRNYTGESFEWFDTVRGANKMLQSAGTQAQSTVTNYLNSFNSNGITVGSNANVSGYNYCSWTFREQAKFFDVLTYTGNGTAGRTISHNLGSVPGCIIVKAYSVDTGDYWGVYHRSLGATKAIFLSATNAAATSSTYWNDTAPTSTNFTVGDWSGVNQNGTSYVAYLFAHDAGGFGLTGTDNVISCGTFTTDGSGLFSVTLGYEPQWVMVKRSSGVGDWIMFDTMRGMPTAAASGIFSATLLANTTAAEDAAGGTVGVTATGFNSLNGYLASSNTFIYIAIRRGPMRTPTVGTSVFYPTTYTGTGSARTFSGFGFPPDFEMSISTGGSAAGDNNGPEIFDKLRGTRVRLLTPSTDAQFTTSESVTMIQDGISVSSTTNSYINASGFAKVLYGFKRAPSFFDEVCYAGQNSAPLVNSHNLGVTPELAIIKNRTTATDWLVQTQITGLGNYLNLNTVYALSSAPYFITAWTSTTFTLSNGITATNTLGSNYVAWLFATCPGVSKVGSYTGTGAAQTINCGFTTGARFVLIKRTDGSAGWHVWDSARGIIPSNDPYLLLNSTAAEVTGTDYLDTTSVGFDVTSTAPAAINANGGTYIFLAIA